jgi:hypothetical protein
MRKFMLLVRVGLFALEVLPKEPLYRVWEAFLQQGQNVRDCVMNVLFYRRLTQRNSDKVSSAFICVYLLISAVDNPALAVNFMTNNVNTINASCYSLLSRSPCPENLESLVDRLLQDLPSYANRVIARSRFSTNTNTPPGSALPQIIVAGRPEFEPLPLNPGSAIPENAHQVFITTLERQYRGGKSAEIQQYHWLFFTQTDGGWELVKIISTLGTVADVPPLLPPEGEKSAIAEAIRLWLRDCRDRRAFSRG